MTEVKGSSLRSMYPEMYSSRPPGYFIVRSGWKNLLNNLSSDLQKHINESGCQQVVALQAKEKFGELRFYYQGGDDECARLIKEACAKSVTICLECGDKAELVSKNGWIAPLCKTHELE